jgi:predicted AlkP superfamily pyrophosphatase or phosphodiesterase
MGRSLTIFIDALPFDQLHKMPYAREFKSRARLIPILGYSVNCQTQLFTGKTPDELGFWCEWQYDPSNSPFRRWRWLLSLVAPLERSYIAKRVIHKVLDRLGWVSCTKNIPLRLLADFAETGHTVFNRKFFVQESLLDHPDLNVFLHCSFPVIEQRDEDAFHAALEYIQSTEDPGHVLVTFTRIDATSHHEGVASPPYEIVLARNDEYIRELSEAFLEKNPDGRVFVVSDHGMSNIEHPVRTNIEDRFGPPIPGRYAYFVEGTILRVWCADPALRDDIAAYLDGIDGITRRDFGDLIYHSLESYQFVPSFWGSKPSVGMHGHHPRYPGQHGVCLSTRAGDFEGEVRAPDFYRVLAEDLSA